MITRISSCLRQLRRMISPTEWFVAWFGLPRERAEGHPRGLVLIQIDGLSRKQLERGLASGKLPFLQRLQKHDHYQLHSLYSGLPSSTPSVQGELFYRQRTAVPAFGFKDHRTGKMERMFHRNIASEIEHRLEERAPGLLRGGSAYCNVYSGGAKEAHFCASSLGWSELFHAVQPWKQWTWIIWHFASLLRTLGLLAIELILATIDFVRGNTRRQEFWQELMMIPARVVVVILMRELATIGATLDIARGLPIVQLNYLGFDEQAHRRGPASPFAHWTLRGIDRSIRQLTHAARRSSSRDYDVWIYSDHGQETTTAFELVAGCRIWEAVRQGVDRVAPQVNEPELATVGSVSDRAPTKRHISQSLSENPLPRSTLDTNGKSSSKLTKKSPSRAEWLGLQWMAGRLFGDDPRYEGKGDDDTERVEVAALGPLGLVYVKGGLDGRQRREVARLLVSEYQVPLVFLKDQDRVWGFNAVGEFDVRQEPEKLLGADHPFLDDLPDDLYRLVDHPDAGELVVSGYRPHGNSLTFAVQHGAHAGPGAEETEAFVLLPRGIQAPRKHRYWRPDQLGEAIRELLAENSTETVNGPLERRGTPIGYHASTDDLQGVRVMTYNVHGCVGMDGRLSPSRIARLIEQSHVDIVSLQELDVVRSRSGHLDQSQEIARILEMDCHFHPAWSLAEERYGDAILSRFPLQLREATVLPAYPAHREPRGLLWVEISLPDGQVLQVLNTHLSLFPAERLLQTQWILDKCVSRATSAGPTVLCGDMNATPWSKSYQRLCQTLFDVQTYGGRRRPSPTWFSGRPLARIDHIFTTREIEVHHVETSTHHLAQVASDHLPLVAELILPAKTSFERNSW